MEGMANDLLELIETDPRSCKARLGFAGPGLRSPSCSTAWPPGMTDDEIGEQYPTLPDQAARAAIAYAAVLAREELHPLEPSQR